MSATRCLNDRDVDPDGRVRAGAKEGLEELLGEARNQQRQFV